MFGYPLLGVHVPERRWPRRGHAVLAFLPISSLSNLLEGPILSASVPALASFNPSPPPTCLPRLAAARPHSNSHPKPAHSEKPSKSQNLIFELPPISLFVQIIYTPSGPKSTDSASNTCPKSRDFDLPPPRSRRDHPPRLHPSFIWSTPSRSAMASTSRSGFFPISTPFLAADSPGAPKFRKSVCVRPATRVNVWFTTFPLRMFPSLLDFTQQLPGLSQGSTFRNSIFVLPPTHLFLSRLLQI